MFNPNDFSDTAFLTLTVAHYMFHCGEETKHTVHRAYQKLKHPERHGWNAILATVLAVALSACVQSGPALFYLSHLVRLLSGHGS